MPDLRVISTTARDLALAKASLRAFRARLRGPLYLPGDPGYERARRIWNAMIDRRPAMIVRCAGAADVIRAVDFAREHGLAVSVKGGGHSVAGNAVGEASVMIDLSSMRSIRVDPRHHTARVEPGCRLGDLDRETQAFGLATPAGTVSNTGVAGLTLGGGIGWLSRKYGLTLDNLLSADVVTAAGQLVTASQTENRELFWGIRGGGGNFGVVTSFEFGLHEVGPEVYSGMIVLPFSAAEDYLRFHREFVSRAPDELTLWLVIRRAPPLPFLPKHAHGELIIALSFVYLGDPAHGAKLIAPLRSFTKPLGEAIGMTPYTTWQTCFDEVNASGARNYWKSHFLPALGAGTLDAVIEHAAKLPSPQSEISVAHLGGAISRVPAAATAYAHRSALFVLNIHARWERAEDDEACSAWACQLFEATRPHSTGGVYINFMGAEDDARVREAYNPVTWGRLVRLKNRYDPGNLFRWNQNVRERSPARCLTSRRRAGVARAHE